jgi:hypothetical protein
MQATSPTPYVVEERVWREKRGIFVSNGIVPVPTVDTVTSHAN